MNAIIKFRKHFLSVILIMVSCIVFAETETLFSFTGTGSQDYPVPATGWTTEGSTAGGAYVRLNNGAIISPLYASYADLSFAYAIAKVSGAGDDTNAELIILDDNDEVQASYSLIVATGTAYTTGSLSIGEVDHSFKIKLSGANTRLRNIVLTGVPSSATNPEIIVTEESIPAMAVNIGLSATEIINVAGVDLINDITLSITGTDMHHFHVTPETLIQEDGTIIPTSVTVTYSPTTLGSHSATLNIASGAVVESFSLSGNATTEGESLFSFTGTGSQDYTVPAEGWVSDGETAGGAYVRLNGGSITSPLFDPHTELTFLYFLAASSNTSGGTFTQLEVLDEYDEVQETHTLISASSTTYISALQNLGDIAYNFKLRLYGTTDGQGTRLRNLILYGTPESGPQPSVSVAEENVPSMNAKVGEGDTEVIHISGDDLTDDILLSLGGDDAGLFSVSHASISPVEGVVTSTAVTITYEPTGVGTHTAILTISSEDAESIVLNLEGAATDISTASLNIDAETSIFTQKGAICFISNERLIVHVFNLSGVIVYDGVSVEGFNRIAVPSGSYLIRFGDKTEKVVVK